MVTLLQYLVAWVVAYLVATILFVIYPQADPMCAGQTWRDCISDIDIAFILLNPVNAIVTAGLIFLSFIANCFWPKTTAWIFLLPTALAAGVVCSLFFPAEILDQWEKAITGKLGMGLGEIVWLFAAVAPYATGLLSIVLFRFVSSNVSKKNN